MIDRSSYEPLYIQIRKDIEEQILSGAIKIGDKLMSETEMLRYYNVGRVTVRAALAELVSSGCLKKEQGLGTFCAAMPKREVRKNIDVLLNMGDTYFIPYFLSGISRILDATNCNLILHDTLDSMETIARTLCKIVEHGTDGIILQPYTGSDDPSDECRAAIELCQERKVPFLTIDGKFKGIDLPCVMNDDNLGGLLAARHLIEMGHTRILGLFRKRYKDSSFRAAGYLQAMKEAGLSPYVLDADQTEESEVSELIHKEQITAIMCYNDLLAVEYYHYLSKAGLRIPADVSVVGYDNTELSVTSLPRITSVTHPKDLMGEQVARFLLRMIDGEKLENDRFMFKPNLMERDSVRKM